METLIIPYAVRAVIASLIPFSFKLSWFDWDWDAYTTTQFCWHPSNSHRSNRARTEIESWNQWTGPVCRLPLPTNASLFGLDLSCTVRSRADCTGASKTVFFLFTTGVNINNFQPNQSALSSQNRDPTNLVHSCERWDRLKVPNRALRNQSHLFVCARGRAQTDHGL